MRATLSIALVVFALAAAGACSPLTTDVAGDCIQTVRIDGIYYEQVDYPLAVEDFAPGESYAAVTLFDPACGDVVVNGEIIGDPGGTAMEDGESNFLPEGTQLYTWPGYDPAMRLVARLDGEWLPLQARSY